MAKSSEQPPAAQSAGPSTDRNNTPVVDPTANVVAILEAAVQRQDDLRVASARRLDDLAAQRAHYDTLLAEKESQRIDAIRAVDVGAVQRAAEVAAAQAEALRNQVAAAATATAAALAAALDPIQKSIDDLRRAQYEAQGQKTQVVEGRATSGAVYAAIGFAISLILAAAVLIPLLANK